MMRFCQLRRPWPTSSPVGQQRPLPRPRCWCGKPQPQILRRTFTTRPAPKNHVPSRPIIPRVYKPF